MQALDMLTLRSLHLYRTFRFLSVQSPNYPQFPKNIHSTPQRQFPSTAAADEPNTYGWSALPKPPPADSSPQLSPSVETVYDPATGRLVTKRERHGAIEPESSAKAEAKPTAEVGSRVYGDVIGSSSSARSSIKKKKSRSVHVCSSCGYSDGQWWGTCKQCGEVGTMKRFATESAGQKVTGMRVSDNAVRSCPVKLTDVYGQVDSSNWRIPLDGEFGDEVERVLGGGLVPGSLVLVGGDPGVGKSTLLLQVAALIAEGIGRVLYVSGEESVEQIGNRADRLCIETEELFLHSSTDIEDILEQAQRLSPKALVIDSIQTVYLTGVTGSSGGDVQVKECTSALQRFAKKTNIPVLLIGHVTKTGDIAGPRVLEHIVDVVLYLEGEKFSSHRLLRSVKNRFGSTEELGVFKMSQSGLQGVLNPSEMFLADPHSDSDYLAGLAVAVIMDGSRAFLIEVQALCVAGSSSVVRHVNGVQGSRADMIISVIIKQAGLKLQENGIFLNVVSGVSLTETAGDLAIAAAICSSFLEFPIPHGIAFVAEVGLGGELRMVAQLEKRVSTVAKLGYKKCIVPKQAEKSLSEVHRGPEAMEIVGCNNLKEMINSVFTSN
ncbi:DNA repair protein RadA-like isoform X1 [Salvia splendens]|uniref:DNA repair protein RadA-like isoform X1 n=1 Tax=Salvia splendens TaxID=180675 RepID=UPI001C258711|nr:DNA repair protein RadA-like isoform X1 [Salvia splendens]